MTNRCKSFASFVKPGDKGALYEEALNRYGIDKQIDIMIEECAELTVALLNYKRKRNDKGDLKAAVVEELADVSVIGGQMKMFFGTEEVHEMIDAKFDRLRERLSK